MHRHPVMQVKRVATTQLAPLRNLESSCACETCGHHPAAHHLKEFGIFVVLTGKPVSPGGLVSLHMNLATVA